MTTEYCKNQIYRATRILRAVLETADDPHVADRARLELGKLIRLADETFVRLNLRECRRCGNLDNLQVTAVFKTSGYQRKNRVFTVSCPCGWQMISYSASSAVREWNKRYK